MVDLMKYSLSTIKYDKKVTGNTMFNDMKEMGGWDFLTTRIFELPRNQQYLNVIDKRHAQAYEIKQKEQKRKLAALKKMYPRMSLLRIN